MNTSIDTLLFTCYNSCIQVGLCCSQRSGVETPHNPQRLRLMSAEPFFFSAHFSFRRMNSFRTLEEQAALLVKRGMKSRILSEPELKHEMVQRLKFINYYRLSPYWYNYRIPGNPNECFQEDTYWEDILRYYHFDRALRSLLLDAISRFEISLRTQLAYCWGDLNRNLKPRRDESVNYPHKPQFLYFENERARERYESILKKVDESFMKSNTDCALHYRNQKGVHSSQDLPIWVFVEFCTFGNLTSILSEMNNKRILASRLLKVLAGNFGYSRVAKFCSMTSLMRTVRNACAHQARIWNERWVQKKSACHPRNWLPIAGVPDDPLFELKWDAVQKQWSPCPAEATANARWQQLPGLLSHTTGTAAVLCLCAWLLRTIAPKSRWCERAQEVLTSRLPSSNDWKVMGFAVEAWRTHPLWRTSR